MNEALLKPEIQEFIFSYAASSSKLAFSGSPFPEVSTSELVQQIESRRTIEKKLPTWFATRNLLYPQKLNLEQTSSEATATYKTSLVQGKTLADITGGFGIDAFYFAEKFENVFHFETNEALSHLAAHNFEVFAKRNILCNAVDGIQGIADSKFDVIYVDPSRRNESKGKVFFLNDCEPNVPEHLEYLLDRCHTLLVKTSPMLDISVGMQELKYVAEVHIVALHNEVKEVLWKLKREASETLPIHTVNITSTETEIFTFMPSAAVETVFSNPLRFLYEPNAAILKGGGFQYISEAYKLKKLHKHSHLFTSEALRDFPGRTFLIKKVVSYTRKEMRGITFAKANITTRNFPESVATLRKKWKIKEGGAIYLFFTTLENEDKIMLICAKV
ncbi:THUMP-like domain-containing protein [Rasiella sp. SM2506]|uniref:THUMP-like domain-containing protein n=1 Tax=Rasiella sp. SM2506 TaxID=3423914 RepID=UPI003D7A0866